MDTACYFICFFSPNKGLKNKLDLAHMRILYHKFNYKFRGLKKPWKQFG